MLNVVINFFIDEGNVMNNNIKMLILSNVILLASAVNQNVVGGVVQGLLNHATVSLYDSANPQNKITVGNGAFVMPNKFEYKSSYNIQLQQNAYGCKITNSSGTNIDNNVTNILVQCNEQPFTTLYNFSGPDGRYPNGVLTTVGNDGFLYGTTDIGGNGYGTIFKLNPTTGEFTTIYKFSESDGGLQTSSLTVGNDGFLYGTTELGGVVNVCGAYSCGTIFKLNPTTGEFSTIYKFSAVDGYRPQAPLTMGNDGLLYGSTVLVHTFTGVLYGTIFKFDPKTGVLTTLHIFNLADGDTPRAALLPIVNDDFIYGSTIRGGSGNKGTIFKISSTTGALTTLYNFSKTEENGSFPLGSLITFGSDGFLYGTTTYGSSSQCASYGCGSIFKINPTTGEFITLYKFSSTDGGNPYASLTTMGNDGFLYGTTYGGGNSNSDCGNDTKCGTIFKFDPTTGVLTTLYMFSGNDGSSPTAPLTTMGNDGFLYGTTYRGGTSGYGTIFKINPNIVNKSQK